MAAHLAGARHRDQQLLFSVASAGDSRNSSLLLNEKHIVSYLFDGHDVHRASAHVNFLGPDDSPEFSFSVMRKTCSFFNRLAGNLLLLQNRHTIYKSGLKTILPIKSGKFIHTIDCV